MALRTKRNTDREGSGPFHLRAGESKKVPLCSRYDGERTELEINYEADFTHRYMQSVKHCELQVAFYGAPTPTVAQFDLDVNERGELEVTRPRDGAQASQEVK